MSDMLIAKWGIDSLIHGYWGMTKRGPQILYENRCTRETKKMVASHKCHIVCATAKSIVRTNLTEKN